jgi:hypothetical protein
VPSNVDDVELLVETDGVLPMLEDIELADDTT